MISWDMDCMICYLVVGFYSRIDGEVGLIKDGVQLFIYFGNGMQFDLEIGFFFQDDDVFIYFFVEFVLQNVYVYVLFVVYFLIGKKSI